MKFITIISHVLTLSLFFIGGFLIIFSIKFIIEKVDQKISSSKVEVENVMIDIVEELPRFPGCEDKPKRERKACSDQKMLQFVYGNIIYPAFAREKGVEGTVVIRFYIDKDGTVKDPEILKDIGAGVGAEALRVVNMMKNMGKKWIPGTQRGKAVKVYYNLPVKFHLE